MRQNVWQLVVFTLSIQMGVGIFVIWGFTTLIYPTLYSFGERLYTQTFLLMSLSCLIVGALAAITHLSKPIRARLAILNHKSSWLSREAFIGVVFGVLVLMMWMGSLLGFSIGIPYLVLIASGIFSGLVLVYSITRLYMLRTVPIWGNPGTLVSFYTTSFLLGFAAILGLFVVIGTSNEILRSQTWFANGIYIGSKSIILLTLIQLGANFITIISTHGKARAAYESVQILWSELRWVFMMRWATALLAFVSLVINDPYGNSELIWLFIPSILVLISEILGRVLFYKQYRRVGY